MGAIYIYIEFSKDKSIGVRGTLHAVQDCKERRRFFHQRNWSGGHHTQHRGNDESLRISKETHSENSPTGDESVCSISDGLSLCRQGDDCYGCGQDQGSGEDQQGDVVVKGAGEVGVLDDAGDLDDLSSAVVNGRSGADPQPDGCCSVK